MSQERQDIADKISSAGLTGTPTQPLVGKSARARVSGTNDNASVDLTFEGFALGTSRMIVIDGEVNTEHTHLEIYSNAPARTLHAYSHAGSQSLGVIFAGLADARVITATVFQSVASEPLSVRISVPELIKTKTVSKSVLDDRGAAFVKVVGEQPYDLLQRKFGAIFEHDKDFNRFVETMYPPTSPFPGISGWCIGLFCIPIIGIAAFAIPKCRG